MLFPEPFSKKEIEDIFQRIRNIYSEDPISKLTVMGVMDRRDLPQTALTVIQAKQYADIYPGGCNKGSAIQSFCKHLDLALTQCVCFGDSENDVDMFRICPTGICMDDVPMNLRMLAAYHAKGPFGVAEGLELLFGIPMK